MTDMALTDAMIVRGCMFYSVVALSVAAWFVTWLWLERHNL